MSVPGSGDRHAFDCGGIGCVKTKIRVNESVRIRSTSQISARVRINVNISDRVISFFWRAGGRCCCNTDYLMRWGCSRVLIVATRIAVVSTIIVSCDYYHMLSLHLVRPRRTLNNSTAFSKK